MKALTELHDLLDREKRLILAGEFDLVDRTSALKETLLQKISSRLDGDEARELRKKALANARLLEAASHGIHAALIQLEDARSMAEQTTYARNGAKTPLREQARRFEKRL